MAWKPVPWPKYARNDDFCLQDKCHKELDMKSTLLPFFWRVVLSQVHPVSSWTGWNATYKHKRCVHRSRGLRREVSLLTGTTQQKLRSRCGKIGRIIMENNNGRNARGCGIAECSASVLWSSLLLSAVVLTRCWYQRICVFRLP